MMVTIRVDTLLRGINGKATRASEAYSDKGYR